MTQISVLEETPTEENRTIFTSMIEQEKIFHSLLLDKRSAELSQILRGTHEDEASKKYVYCVFGTIALTYIMSCWMTLTPKHNLIENPEYWFEHLLSSLVVFPLLAGYTILNCSFFMNIRYIKALKHFFALSLVGIVAFVVAYLIFYTTWTYGLKY